MREFFCRRYLCENGQTRRTCSCECFKFDRVIFQLDGNVSLFRFYSNVYSQPHTQKHPSKFGWIETKREKNIFFRIIFANLLMTSWDLEKHIVFRVRSNLNCEEEKRNRRSNDTQQKMLKPKKKKKTKRNGST